jgi:hypothetical protein
MNLIETMLSKKIKEVEPTLDILCADRKVLQVASQDFMNYLNFSNLVNKETNILDHADKLEQLHKENSDELEAFLTVWSGIWLKKWKQRSNLLIGKQKNQNELSKAPEADPKAESLWTKLECREEMIGIVTSSLIKNAEICGTRIIAENLLKVEIRKNVNIDINNKEQVFAILNNALRRVHEIAQRKGPLISIKIDKSYYCQVNN